MTLVADHRQRSHAPIEARWRFMGLWPEGKNL